MRLRKKLCAIGLSCMLGVLCCVPASAAQNSELCYQCGRGDLIETDKVERTYDYKKCAVCWQETVLIQYYERIHYFACNYPYCDYVEDYSVPKDIECVYPCWFCGLFDYLE